MLPLLLRTAVIFVLAGLILPPAALAGDPAASFRKQNGLVAYQPPAWFLEGHFVAREQRPRYVFGRVKDFRQALGCPTTWLIEDLELARLKRVLAAGKKPEFTLYLEASLPGQTKYWVFVALPYDNAQQWFRARWAFHKRKTKGYYGQTMKKLQQAMDQGLKIKGELRFLIENGKVSLRTPEEVILQQTNLRPVFDLGQGRRLGMAPGTK